MTRITCRRVATTFVLSCNGRYRHRAPYVITYIWAIACYGLMIAYDISYCTLKIFWEFVRYLCNTSSLPQPSQSRGSCQAGWKAAAGQLLKDCVSNRETFCSVGTTMNSIAVSVRIVSSFMTEFRGHWNDTVAGHLQEVRLDSMKDLCSVSKLHTTSWSTDRFWSIRMQIILCLVICYHLRNDFVCFL